MQYIVICQQIVGGDRQPFVTEYSHDGRRFPSRDAAISHGFTLGRSDDFNIGVLDAGQLVSFDWMDKKVVESAPERLRHIAEQIYLRSAA